MAIRSLDDLRAQAGQDWADSSDEDLISAYAKSVELDPASVANRLGYKAEDSGKSSNRFGASIDRYQAGLYGLGEAVTGALGLEGTSESMAARRRANELEADVYSLRAREQGAIESYKDVGGVRDAADYVAGLAIQSAPYLAESLVGGIAGRAVMGGTKAALRGAITAGDDVAAAAARQSLNRGATMGAVASSYPSAVSDVLGSQREQAGETDLGSAAALGVPYAALNAFGIEGALARREGFRNTMNMLDSVSGVKGGVARAAATGTRVGAVEGLSETAQEGLNQFGRMVVDPNEAFLTDASRERFAESFVGGAALGGIGASAAGGWRRSQPGSVLKDVNNSGTETGTETNAINSAIDSQAPAATINLPVTSQITTDTEQAQQAAAQAAAQQQKEQALLAEQQAAVEAENKLRQATFAKYGGTVMPRTNGNSYIFQGKPYHTEQALNIAMEKLVAEEKAKSPMQLSVEDAYLQANALTGGKALSPAALSKTVAGYIDQAQSIEEVLARVQIDLDNALKSVKSQQQLAKIEPIHALRDELAGIPVEQRVPTIDLLPKGKQDERLQLQQQSDAGVRAVSEQGGAAQRDGNRPGVLQPSGVQPVQPGSVTQGQTSQQVGAVPAGGVRISPVVSTTGGPSVQSGQDENQRKGQGQINEQGQLQTTSQEGRDSVPGQDVEGSRTAAEEAQARAESVVSEVVNSIIEAIVKRTGRMSAKNLASLKEFMYYDFFQVASKDKEGLSVKELAEMYKVSSDTIDGWRDIAGKFFDENRGVIQAKILEGIAAQGTTLEQLKLDLQAVRNAKQSDVAILEEAEALITGKGEKLNKDEAEIEEAARGELEGFKLDADESTLDQRDLGSETGGMSVSTGRVQKSIQEEDKPEETINARIKRKLEAYSKAVENGDEAKEAVLMAEIDDLTKEAKKVDTKRVAKATAIAEDKAPAKKQPKERKKRAVQKPSAEKVPVREGTGSSEGVRKEDTEKRKTAAESKAEDFGLTKEEKRQNEIEAQELADKKKYEARRKEIEAEEKELGAYLADAGVDNENAAPLKEGQAGYWSAMLASQENAYQMRKEELEAGETLTEKAQRAWDKQAAQFNLPSYGSLNEKAQKDWQDSVESGNTKLADMNVVFENNKETKTVSDEKLDDAIAELPKAQVKALETHYGVTKDSNEFFDRVKEDVVNYINKGAQAVSGAIRSIIKSISEGMLAVALVFNPGTYQSMKYDLPAFMTETRTIVAEAPKNVEMTAVAQQAYAVSAPTFAKAKTPFFIADKPNGKIHLFDDTGKHVATSDALYGKSTGDVLTAESRNKKADELADIDKVTPAGTYTITVSPSAEYAGGYTLRLNDNNGDLGGIAIHSVYLGDPKENRLTKLASKAAGDKKVSYGCINTTRDFFVNKIMPRVGEFNNAGVVVIPDAQDTLMAYMKPTTEVERKKTVSGRTTVDIKAKEETIPVTVDNKAKTPITRIFASRAIKLFSDLRRVLTREQFDVLNNLDYQTVELDSETKESVEMAFVTLQDLAKFPSIVKALQALKLSPQALLSIDKFAIFKNEGAFEGSDGIQTTYVDGKGNLQVVLGMNESGFLSRTDEEITHTFLHETGHGVDLPGYEAGVYSSQPEFRKGGMVREELTNLYKSDEDFAFLAYPLSNKQDEEVTRGELFAQAWAAYLNPEFRAVMEKKAPQTAKYMEDVLNDVKTTTFSRGTPEATAGEIRQKAKLFANYRGQRLASAKGDVKINLTPAEKRYVNSDQFQEDVTQFAQDEGFENELLLSDEFFDIDNKANQLTIPESMVSAMRKFFDWLVYSDAGYLGKIPPRFRSGKTFFNRRQQGNIQKLPKQLQGPVSEITTIIRDLGRRGLTYFAFTEDLARIASKYVKSATEYVNLVREQQAVKTKYERRVDLILQQYDKLDASVRGTGPGTVNAFLKKSTMDGKWAFDPGYLKKAPDIDPVLEAEFKALPKEAQDVVKAVFKHGHDTLQDMKRGVIENINSEYDALIKDARDKQDMIEVADLEQKKAASLKDYSTLMGVRASKPYAPLKRFGNYVVVAKSNAYLQAEKDAKDKSKTAEQRKEAQGKIRELEKNETDYYVAFAETKREGRKIEEQLLTEGYGYVSEAFEKDSAKQDVYGGRDVQNVFYRLRNLANDSMDEAGGAKATQAINRLIADLHLTLLAEQSARQSERRRKNVAGAEDDMMRSFATQGLATAHFISTLHNSGKIYDTLQQMRQEADEQKPGRDIRREYYNEFMRRHALGLSYEPSPLINKALGVTSFWMLLTNPAYYLQNMTQPFMMSLPYVAGKHDYDKAWGEFTTAYKQIFNMIKNEGLSEESYSKLPADVREAIETLVNNGRIDISLDQDLGRWRDTEGSKAELAGKAIEKLRKVAQDIESVNRVATAVAAYRLEIKAGSNKEQAVAYADEVILRTHGDYSGFNAPRITRQGLGRVATQFRKFQLIQISLMAKLIKDSFAGASKEEKMIARRALGFTLGHTLAVGGVMGLPGFAAIAWIMGAAFGDDDEPDNPELTLRKMIGDKALADVILKGAPKFAGVDLSGKLGMGQMLSILPYTDVDLSRAGIAQGGYALLTGATGSLVQKAGEGVALMADGEYYKGLERLSPAGLSQTMKGARFGLMDGVTLKNGDVVIKPEDIDFLDMLSVAIGLPSNKITDRTFVQGAAIDTEQFYKDRTGEIKRDYVKASSAKDAAGMAEARKEWQEMQEAKRRNKLKTQPLSDLLRAPQEQKKREAGVVGGVTTTKSNREYMKQISKI